MPTKINISDQNGRGLEFCIVREIIKRFGFKTDKTTAEDQLRDILKYEALSSDLKIRFMKASGKIAEWLETSFNVSKSKTKTLRRLKDNEAKSGNVSDICINLDSEVVNLSIKHNHAAIKHQRPGALPRQTGYDKTSKESIEFKKNYAQVTSRFEREAKKHFPDCTHYKKLNEKDENYINEHLYKPMCDMVADFLNNHAQAKHAQDFFSFLVGNINFYKAIVYGDKIEIYEYAEIEQPNRLTATVERHNNISVTFSNGWVVGMRLHTASGKLAGVPIKFDTQPVEVNVPKTTHTY